MAGDRRHGAKLLAEIEPAIGGFEIGVAKVDQRHDVIMADGLNCLGHLGRRLTILAGFGGEDILKRDPHAIALAEFRQLEKRFPLAAVGIGPLGDLVGTQGTTMLNEDARADAIAQDGQRLGCIYLVAARYRVHEIGRNKTVHRVTEVEFFGEGHEPLSALLDDATACDQIKARCGDFNGVAANFGKRTKIAFECGQFTVVRAGVEAGSNKIAHVIISRGKEGHASSGCRTARRAVSNRSGRSILT